ncbi:MAG: CoA-binding protein [bacterium]
MEEKSWFDYAFYPRGVAIIGASPHDLATLAQMSTKIKEKLFLVNPNYKEIRGQTCYPNILAIKEPIDYAILVIPAVIVPQVLEECIQKGVKVAQIYSSGFSETGMEERMALEKKVQEVAAGRIRIIGPNCFGVYCPQSGLAIIPEAPAAEGRIGVIAQSGSVAESLLYFAFTHNLRFSKVISYGNGLDLDAPDFLEYLVDDAQTEIIALYIEGTRNAARLKKALQQVARQKPVVAIKGGVTAPGLRVAISHTGALGGTPEIWQALFKQTGVLEVENFKELLNVLIALDHSPLPFSPGLSIITNSGGFSVIQTDFALRLGLDIPKFSLETIKALRQIVPLAGTSVSNPLDAWPIFYSLSAKANIAEIIKIVAADQNVSSLILHFDQFRYLRRALGREVEKHMQVLIPLMVEGCVWARERAKKVVFVSVSLDPFLEDEEERYYNLLLKKEFSAKGFPVFASLEEAIKTLAYLCQWTGKLHNHPAITVN